jgi:hypothetical protein
MHIFVKGLSGITRTLDVNPWDTVLSIKEKIESLEGISPRSQRIIWAGRQLEDDRLLNESNIAKESTLHVLARLPGGCE